MYIIKQYKAKIEGKGDFGNFCVYKMFKINNKTTKPKGIIIQCIVKKTIVIDAISKIYNTTKKIDNLTSNNVKYSNDRYFEIFRIDDKGISQYGDKFQNNSLTKYDDDNEPYTYDKNDPEYNVYKTKGEIKMLGTNCFISEDNEYYDSIYRGLRWNSNPNTPANGLPFLIYTDALYEYIFGKSDSNILVHNVNVTWNFEKHKSVVKSNFKLYDNYLQLETHY